MNSCFYILYKDSSQQQPSKPGAAKPRSSPASSKPGAAQEEPRSSQNPCTKCRNEESMNSWFLHFVQGFQPAAKQARSSPGASQEQPSSSPEAARSSPGGAQKQLSSRILVQNVETRNPGIPSFYILYKDSSQQPSKPGAAQEQARSSPAAAQKQPGAAQEEPRSS